MGSLGGSFDAILSGSSNRFPLALSTAAKRRPFLTRATGCTKFGCLALFLTKNLELRAFCRSEAGEHAKGRGAEAEAFQRVPASPGCSDRPRADNR